MRITCPNCTAGFEIPTELLGRKGRSLKCATCGHSWFQAAIVDEIDLADVIAETKARDVENDMGGSVGRRSMPDTAAIAAAANEAIGKPTDPSIPPPTPSGGLGTAGGPAPKPKPAPQPAPSSDVPEGAKSLLGHRKNQQQQPPGEATSMMDDGGAIGGPQAAAMAGTSLKGQAGVEGVGDEGRSWFEQEPAAQAGPEQGASGGPGAAPAAPNDPATAAAQPPAGAQGGPGAPPQAPAVASAADPGQAAAANNGSNPAPLAGASGGPGAAPQGAGAQPGAPGQSLRQDESTKVPGEAAVSWLEREPGAAGVPGMPGMPGAQPDAGAMGGAPGAPPGGAPGSVSPAVQSLMDRDRAAGPGGQAVSQLTGEQMKAPGLGAQSLISGEQVVPGGPAASMRDEQGAQGGPGAPGVSQMGDEIDAPGDAARSLLGGSEQEAGGAQGGAPEAGASGGPGQSMLEDDEGGGPGADGGPGDGGASGGPGGAPGSGDEDDDAFFQGEKGSSDDDLDDDPLADEDDDDAFFQGAKGAGEDDLEDDAPGSDDDDDAFFQGAKKGSGEEDDDLVDPDDDRPDFGGVAGESDDDELDEDPLVALIDEDSEKPDKKPKKKKKPIDPVYVTAGVLTAVVLLVAGVLFAARDQLSALWPGIEGVYEALNLDDDNAEGLRLSAPQPVRIMKGGVQTLVVTGFVTNLTDQIRPVPAIKLMLIDRDNEVVQETSAPPESPTIDPNSTLPYRIELQLPVESATSLQVDWD